VRRGVTAARRRRGPAESNGRKGGLLAAPPSAAEAPPKPRGAREQKSKNGSMRRACDGPSRDRSALDAAKKLFDFGT
jgi:hypothetical protein